MVPVEPLPSETSTEPEALAVSVVAAVEKADDEPMEPAVDTRATLDPETVTPEAVIRAVPDALVALMK